MRGVGRYVPKKGLENVFIVSVKAFKFLKQACGKTKPVKGKFTTLIQSVDQTVLRR